MAVVSGVPEMTGGVFGCGNTVIENAGSDTAKPALLDAKITILECVAATVGVPLSRPVVVENAAHDGLFIIPNELAPVEVG